MSRLNKYSKEARQALANARAEAQRLRHRVVGTEHLLLGILKLNDPMIEKLFASVHVNTSCVIQAIEFVVGRGNKALIGEPALGTAARVVLTVAEREATDAQVELVGVEHLLLGLFSEHDGVTVGVLESFGIYLNPARQSFQRLLMAGSEQVSKSHQYQTKYDATFSHSSYAHLDQEIACASEGFLASPRVARRPR